MPEKVRDLRRMLFYLIEGIQQWKKDLTHIPEQLYNGQLLFIKYRAMTDSNLPNDLHSLIKVLLKPSREWGIPFLEKVFSPDSSLIEPLHGLTSKAVEFLEVHQSIYETDQSIMKRILDICRNLNLTKEYRFIRTFLSDRENSVIDAFELNMKINTNIEYSELRNLVFECYELLPEPISNYKKCPHCGWTLEYRNGNWYCNKENTCRLLADFENISDFEFTNNNKVYRLKSGIQRYILIPGIHENELGKKLIKRGFPIEMYPEVDKFDIRIQLADSFIDLDVKDYHSPYQLANLLNELPDYSLEKYHDNSYVMIPSYRLQISPSFLDIISSRLRDEVKKQIQIISEKQLFSILGGEAK